MTTQLSKKKKDEIVTQCRTLLEKLFVTIRDVIHVVGHLSSTAIAFFLHLFRIACNWKEKNIEKTQGEKLQLSDNTNRWGLGIIKLVD